MLDLKIRQTGTMDDLTEHVRCLIDSVQSLYVAQESKIQIKSFDADGKKGGNRIKFKREITEVRGDQSFELCFLVIISDLHFDDNDRWVIRDGHISLSSSNPDHDVGAHFEILHNPSLYGIALHDWDEPEKLLLPILPGEMSNNIFLEDIHQLVKDIQLLRERKGG